MEESGTERQDLLLHLLTFFGCLFQSPLKMGHDDTHRPGILAEQAHRWW